MLKTTKNQQIKNSRVKISVKYVALLKIPNERVIQRKVYNIHNYVLKSFEGRNGNGNNTWIEF